MSKAGAAMVGAVIGAVIGYPLSYWCQAEIIRGKLSLGEYIKHIGDVMKDKDLRPTAIGVWVACVVILAVVGALVGGRRSRRPEQPPPVKA
jgi:hypothetical protein